MTEPTGYRDGLRITRVNLKSRPLRQIPAENSIDRGVDDDRAATTEAVALAEEQLEKKALSNDHRRTESFRDAVASGVLIVFWACLAMALAAGLIWFLHTVCPPAWHFLPPPQIEKIGNVLFGGITSLMMSKYASKRLGA